MTASWTRGLAPKTPHPGVALLSFQQGEVGVADTGSSQGAIS